MKFPNLRASVKCYSCKIEFLWDIELKLLCSLRFLRLLWLTRKAYMGSKPLLKFWVFLFIKDVNRQRINKLFSWIVTLVLVQWSKWVFLPFCSVLFNLSPNHKSNFLVGGLKIIELAEATQLIPTLITFQRWYCTAMFQWKCGHLKGLMQTDFHNSEHFCV